MLVDLVCGWHGPEWHITVQIRLFLIASLPLLRLLVHEVLVRILPIVEFLEVTATVLKLNVASLLNLTVEVRLDLASTPLADITGE